MLSQPLLGGGEGEGEERGKDAAAFLATRFTREGRREKMGGGRKYSGIRARCVLAGSCTVCTGYMSDSLKSQMLLLSALSTAVKLSAIGDLKVIW